MASAQDLIQKVAGSPVGQPVALTYLRDIDGKLEKRTANVVLGERPGLQISRPTEPTLPKKGYGAQGQLCRISESRLQEITQQLIAEKHLSGVRGLYVKEVDPNGLAADVRLAGGQPALAKET